MTTKVTMPQMGESIFEGTLTKWLKKVGDNVVRDEPLFEISTDKVDSEIPSPVSGVLSQILVPEGKTVQINTVLAIINEEGAEEKETPITHSREVALKEIPEEAPAKPEPRPVNSEPKKIEMFPARLPLSRQSLLRSPLAFEPRIFEPLRWFEGSRGKTISISAKFTAQDSKGASPKRMC